MTDRPHLFSPHPKLFFGSCSSDMQQLTCSRWAECPLHAPHRSGTGVSYAQATAAGTRAAAEAARDAGGATPQQDHPKLSFSIGGHQLSSFMTIFQVGRIPIAAPTS